MCNVQPSRRRPGQHDVALLRPPARRTSIGPLAGGDGVEPALERPLPGRVVGVANRPEQRLAALRRRIGLTGFVDLLSHLGEARRFGRLAQNLLAKSLPSLRIELRLEFVFAWTGNDIAAGQARIDRFDLIARHEAGVLQCAAERVAADVECSLPFAGSRVPAEPLPPAADLLAERGNKLLKRLLAGAGLKQPSQRRLAGQLVIEHVVDDVVVGKVHQQRLGIALPAVSVER